MKIEELKPGKRPHFLMPSFANKVIRAVNSWLHLKFNSEDFAQLTVAGDNATIDFAEVTVAAVIDSAAAYVRVVGVDDTAEEGGSEAAKSEILAALGFEDGDSYATLRARLLVEVDGDVVVATADVRATDITYS